MTRKDQLELRLLMRKIVRVLEWHDAVEQDFPWSWVERTGDGRFELFTTAIVPGATHDYAEPISLGMVVNPKQAHAVLRVYEGWSAAVDRLSWRERAEKAEKEAG
jgi:hypothetical protein